MPSLFGKHSNRSSQALVDPRSSSKTSGTTSTTSGTSGSAAATGAATPQATAHQRQPSHQLQQDQQHQHQHQLLDEADSAAHSVHSAHAFGHSHNASGNANNPANSSATPHSALSSSHNTAFSSSESFDSRPPPPSHHLQQQQQQQTQQQSPLRLQHPQQQAPLPLIPSPSSASAGAAPPPPHLYSSPSAASSTTGANIHNPPSLQQQQSSNLSGFDGHQSHPDFVEPAGGLDRSQSIRYSSTTPYNIATSSVDDLNSHGGGYGQIPPQQLQQHQLQQQPPPPQQQAAPEKRSTRKLIKGIFSGSSRGASDSQHHHHGISIGHGHHHSYDNTGGLARRPSKRPPSLPPPAQAEQIQQVQQVQPVQESQQSPHPSQPSPRQGLDDIHEHYLAHESNPQSPSQNSHLSLNNTIRQVSGEVDQHSYEDLAYRQNQAPPQQQPPQPHVQVHPQDQQQPIYETGVYDQQPSPLNPPQHQSSQQQPYPFPNTQQQANYHQSGDLRIASGHLGPGPQFQNPETVSQFSHESPITDSDQRSANLQSASTSPAVNHSVYAQNHGSTPSLPPAQQITSQQQQQGMAPPAGGPPPSRRNPEAEKLRGQVEPPAGPPPTYRHSTSMNNMNPLPPVPGQAAGQPQAYRGDRPPQFEGQVGEQGRDSPQPASAIPVDAAGEDKSFKDLLTKYKNVKRLYFDGKAQIDVLNGQIVQLQNAVANQRMSQSRTALDDNEYSTRFNRLNGAINNLSFNIRKDWRCVPQWLDKYVSADGLKTGKAEMTAVGRAVISRWIMEEVFNKCFHPGLDPHMSQSLKEIELGIRHNAYTMNSQEEFEALTSKVVSWRMTTLEGLHRQLNSPATADNRTAFTTKATSQLTACLYQFLNTPPPAGVEGSTSMIVELAVGIAANLPLESRDVAITYPLPGDIVQPHVMEIEKAPLPALESQKEDGDGEDKDDGDKDKNSKVKTAALLKDPNRVRFAGFMALEVRGRQVLLKAPIWTL
ncbi:hypothetical protein ACJ41O_011378 [Fusarium nematophilum]